MTHYEILGISKNASQEEIKSAYKKLIKKYHPDLYQGDKSFAEKKAKEINAAYDVLSDENKKAEYDLSINPSYTTNTTQTYNYTPPKYSSNYNPYSSYSNYYKNRYSSTNNYNNSYNYNVNRTQTNSYQQNDKKSAMYDQVYKRLGTNLSVILLVFIIYLIIFIATLMQYKAFQSNRKSTTNISPSPSSSNTSNQNNHYEEFYIDEDDIDEEFDINEYFSDSQLYQMYNEDYKDIFDSFAEFKEAYSLYLQLYYNF